MSKTIVSERHGGFTMTDLLIAAAGLSLLAGYVLAASANLSERDDRIRCAANLRQIGRALLLYGNENRQLYPRTLYEVDTEPTFGTPYRNQPDLEPPRQHDRAAPFASRKQDAVADPKYVVEANDVTGALYLLLRTQKITSEVFVCPSTKQTRWDFGGGAHTALSWTNFPPAVLRDHVSYGYQNPYPSREGVANGFRLNSSTNEDFVVAADMNPGGNVLLQLKPKDDAAKLQRGNSRNHGGQGQNVLLGDGVVEFVTTPFAGMDGDNIFTHGKDGDPTVPGGIWGSSVSRRDSIILPTADAVERAAEKASTDSSGQADE